MERKWRFLSNQNGTIVGINDAGIETFTANMNRSLVREIIQNSLDAVADGCDKPVIVEFSRFDISRESIPDVEDLHNAIRKCKISNQNEPDTFNFFENADMVLSQSKISVLRISDHHTKGLEGSDTCVKGTGWSRLVKESGSSNKGQGSGGSFGIGKAAAFACSDLRTVFYSSKDIRGLESNFGVAKLVSFEEGNPSSWTTGVGYYSEDEKFVAMNELANFDKDYSRIDSGTDIYILGMHEIDNFKEEYIKSVLLDFLVSLVNKKLVVKVQDEIINAKTLPKYIGKLNQYENESIKDLLEYYHLLMSHDPKVKIIKLDSNKYGKKFGFEDGECTLYLKEQEGLNRKILITRKAGMRIFEQNHISGSIGFTGVLVIEGNNMNETFKKMEVPSHDAWEPGRVRGDEAEYKKIFEGFKKYLRDTVKETFGKDVSDTMDALGAGDFLPDTNNEGGSETTKKDEMSTKIHNLIEKTITPSKKTNSDSSGVESAGDVPGDGEEGSGKGDKPGPQTTPDLPHPGTGKGASEGDNGGLGTGNEEGKFYNVKKRLICTNAASGVYTLNFVVPSDSKTAKLGFEVSGEQSEEKLPIIEAQVLDGNSNIKSIQDNELFLSDLMAGENLKIKIKVNYSEYCMMEVKYYAYKK